MVKSLGSGLTSLVAVLIASTGCMGKMATRGELGLESRVAMKPVREGMVATQGVSIWDKDGAFLFAYGAAFATPYFSNECVGGTAENYRAARAGGARTVVVQVPGTPQPLYGLLALCRVPVPASGPDARSYRIQVPPSTRGDP